MDGAGIGFLLKKVLGDLLMPFPLLIGMAVIGLLVVRWRRAIDPTDSFARWGWRLSALGVLTLYLLSIPVLSPPSDADTTPDQPEIPDSIAYIVVLGGGSHEDAGPSALSQLGESSLARLVEGLRVFRTRPMSTLILSEGGRPGRPSTASIMRDAAVELGFDTARIRLEERSRDTADQARAIAHMVGSSRSAIVTSAAHMNRAVLLFRQQGLDPIPVYADYEQHGDGEIGYASFIPTPGTLSAHTGRWHEILGTVWAWLTGG